jgi:hypothetical protein
MCFRQKLQRQSKRTHCTQYFFFPRKSCSLWDHVEKYGTARHTLTICNTYCFSTATMVTRTRLSVTLYVLCFSSLKNNKSLPEKYQRNHTAVHELGARSPELLKFRNLEPSFSDSSKKNLLLVSLLAPRIEVAPLFWKLCEPLHFPHIQCLK